MDQKPSLSGFQIERVNCRVDAGLLADAQRFAASQNITLSQLIRRSLRQATGRAESVTHIDLENGGGCSVPAESLYGPDAPGEGVQDVVIRACDLSNVAPSSADEGRAAQ